MSLNKLITDLGTIDEPCLVFGGPYSNLQATTAILKVAEKHSIPKQRIICTGDVVAYCGEPKATTEIIRESEIHVVMGNCEESIGSNSMQCGCGYEQGSECDILSVQWFRYACEQLDDESKFWMANLPHVINFEMAGHKISVIHGAASSINRFIFPSTDIGLKKEELNLVNSDGVIAGHSGIPFSQLIDHRLWLNAGVIGMPANDGTSRVWYSILTPGENKIEVELIPLAYDFESAVDAMRKNKLPMEYSKTLKSGLWPTDEIMPARDRQCRGIALKPQKRTWNKQVSHWV